MSTPLSDQPPGIDENSAEYQSPDPVEAAQRIIAYVSAFGDGLVDKILDARLFARDLESVAQAISTARVEWGVRYPTKHFGIEVRPASSEDHACAWVAQLHDTEHCLNAHPDAEVVRRTVITSAWEPVR